MKKLVYSPAYKRKIQALKKRLDLEFGREVSKRILQTITARLHSLKEFDESGVSIFGLYGIHSDYRYVFTAHNYVFYCTDSTCVYIIDIFHEREDFMQKLFGVNTNSEDEEHN